jgi:hypothetical protein
MACHGRDSANRTIIQVMVYALMGPQHLRVLEAYFDGKNLIIGQTKLYDMRQGNTITIELTYPMVVGFCCR